MVPAGLTEAEQIELAMKESLTEDQQLAQAMQESLTLATRFVTRCNEGVKMY
jgi:hypothetical protein